MMAPPRGGEIEVKIGRTVIAKTEGTRQSRFTRHIVWIAAPWFSLSACKAAEGLAMTRRVR